MKYTSQKSIKKYTKTAIFWPQNCKFSWPPVLDLQIFLFFAPFRNSCVFY